MPFPLSTRLNWGTSDTLNFIVSTTCSSPLASTTKRVTSCSTERPEDVAGAGLHEPDSRCVFQRVRDVTNVARRDCSVPSVDCEETNLVRIA